MGVIQPLPCAPILITFTINGVMQLLIKSPPVEQDAKIEYPLSGAKVMALSARYPVSETLGVIGN